MVLYEMIVTIIYIQFVLHMDIVLDTLHILQHFIKPFNSSNNPEM